MKRKIIVTMVCAVAVVGAIFIISCVGGDDVMTKKKGVYTINTTTLSQEVKGYNGPTPLLITVEKDKVVKIEALENSETPKFFERMKKGGMLERWNGMTVDEALAAKVDVVSGATYSSNAVKENVHLGLNYYKAHK